MLCGFRRNALCAVRILFYGRLALRAALSCPDEQRRSEQERENRDKLRGGQRSHIAAPRKNSRTKRPALYRAKYRPVTWPSPFFHFFANKINSPKCRKFSTLEMICVGTSGTPLGA